MAEEPAPTPRRGRRKKAEPQAAPEATETPEPVAAEVVADAPRAANDREETADKPAPKRRSRAKKPPETPAAPEAPVLERQSADTMPGAEDEGMNEDGSPRRGWWQRTFGG